MHTYMIQSKSSSVVNWSTLSQTVFTHYCQTLHQSTSQNSPAQKQTVFNTKHKENRNGYVQTSPTKFDTAGVATGAVHCVKHWEIQNRAV